MILSGNAVCVRGDNIDTDVLYPGSFLNIDDPKQMAPFLFEGLDPKIREELVGPTVLVVDDNFGCGSSREHVQQAIRSSGITFVVGKTFARIFYRNCFNLGLPAVVCPEASAAASKGSQLTVDPAAGVVTVDGEVFHARPIPPFMLDMLAAGGLVSWARQRAAR